MPPLPATVPTPPGPKFSPLILADRLITLAQEADRAGYSSSASRLIGAAYAVLDEDRVCEPNGAAAALDGHR